MGRTARTLFWTALFFFIALNAAAMEASPFFTQNQSPLTAVYGLPFVGEPKAPAAGEGSMRLTMDLANNYITGGNAREEITLDGESLRFTLSGRYGIGGRAELGVDVPFWIAGGGFLDGFIEGYHSTFGFPNAGREIAPRNRLLYRYRKDGVTLLNRESSGQGPGDVSLSGAWQLWAGAEPMRYLSIRASLKLPTGDAGALRGSGSTDLAVWLVGVLGHPFSIGRLTLFGAAGAMGMTKGRVLPDIQRPFVGFGALGLGFSPWKWIDFKIQTNVHTPFYSDSDLKQLGAPSAQVTLGGALHVSAKTSLDIGVTEDIVVGASPDVVFHLSLRRSF
jgi:hypothetical protein